MSFFNFLKPSWKQAENDSEFYRPCTCSLRHIHYLPAYTIWAASWENLLFAHEKTKAQISCDIAVDQHLCFCYIVQSLYLLNPKFQASVYFTAQPVSDLVGNLKDRFCWDAAQIYCEPRCEKTGVRDFRPGPTQTGLCSNRRWLGTWHFGSRKKRKCTIQVAKTKALISFTVTAKLICVFVFAYKKIWFSHVAALVNVFCSYYGFIINAN